MNIFTYLKKDHTKVSNLFEKIMSSPESTENIHILEDIINELTLHAETEQATFYKAINKLAKGKDVIIEAKNKHKEIKEVIAIISDLTANTPNWYITLGELKTIVDHHVREEETKIFKIAKKILPKKKIDNLTEEMEQLKEKMRSQVDEY